MSSEAQLTSYEDVPYASKPLYPTHPDCLATVATLLGMQPPAVHGCRVLELGCASAGNLIPMAATLPESRFVGIDLSPRQIASGQAVVDALGLSNIDLRALSILDVDEDLGEFDYIICHGVYSWVPPAVQDKILDICSRNLSANGVAYVSYNTYPGWHARGMVREIMGYHARQFADPLVRVQQARAFLEFLVKSTTEPDGPYARVLREEADLIRPKADYYLFHEHLEDVNQPVYFHQFAKHLADKRLQYLGEAWFHTNLSKFSADVQDTLQHLAADLVGLEQYIDFLDNRTFRRTLVCHDGVRLDRAPSAKTISSLHISALARPMSENPEVSSSRVEEFRADDGSSASTNIALVKAALLALFEAWPKALTFDELTAAVQSRLAGAGGVAALGSPEILAETLLQCYLSNVVSLHVAPARFALTPGERPLASPLARHQSAAGSPITNLRHRIVELTENDRLVLGYLDGTRDRPAMLGALERALGDGTFQWDDDAPAQGDATEPAGSSGPRGCRAPLAEWLEGSLKRLATCALLMQ